MSFFLVAPRWGGGSARAGLALAACLSLYCRPPPRLICFANLTPDVQSVVVSTLPNPSCARDDERSLAAVRLVPSREVEVPVGEVVCFHSVRDEERCGYARFVLRSGAERTFAWKDVPAEFGTRPWSENVLRIEGAADVLDLEGHGCLTLVDAREGARPSGLEGCEDFEWGETPFGGAPGEGVVESVVFTADDGVAGAARGCSRIFLQGFAAPWVACGVDLSGDLGVGEEVSLSYGAPSFSGELPAEGLPSKSGEPSGPGTVELRWSTGRAAWRRARLAALPLPVGSRASGCLSEACVIPAELEDADGRRVTEGVTVFGAEVTILRAAHYFCDDAGPSDHRRSSEVRTWVSWLEVSR